MRIISGYISIYDIVVAIAHEKSYLYQYKLPREKTDNLLASILDKREINLNHWIAI